MGTTAANTGEVDDVRANATARPIVTVPELARVMGWGIRRTRSFIARLGVVTMRIDRRGRGGTEAVSMSALREAIPEVWESVVIASHRAD